MNEKELIALARQSYYLQLAQEVEKIKLEGDSQGTEIEDMVGPLSAYEKEESKTRPLWGQTWFRVVVAAACVVGILVGVGWLSSESILEKPPITQAEQTTSNAVVYISSQTWAKSMANDPIGLEQMPASMVASAEGIADEGSRKRAIHRLKAMASSTSRKPSKPSDEMVYGNGNAATTPPQTSLSKREESYRQLLLGIAYVKAGEYSQALIHLKQVKETDLQQDASWYKGLAYTLLGQEQKAKVELKKVTDSHYEKDKATLIKSFKP